MIYRYQSSRRYFVNKITILTNGHRLKTYAVRLIIAVSAALIIIGLLEMTPARITMDTWELVLTFLSAGICIFCLHGIFKGSD